MKFSFKNEEDIIKLSPFISVILGLIFGYLILLVSGFNPNEGFKYLFEGGLKGITTGSYRRIGDTLSQMTPLMLTGISVAFAFRTGLFNIGASGQMLFGGFVAVFIGVTFDLPPFIHPLVATLGAGIAGALVGFVPGYLKAKFNIHEVVICIMMNYISLWGVQYLVTTYIPGKYDTESAYIAETASLKADFISNIFRGSSLNMGFFIAIIALIVVSIILNKTTFGYELKAVGYNKDASEYAGMNVNRNIVYSMMIAGFLAGLAGATYYIGYATNIKVGALPPQGFDGIAVSLLGMNSPLGVFLSSFLFGFLKNGSSYMASQTAIPSELVDIVIASIIYFAAISTIINKYLIKVSKKLNKGSDK